jgi:hypothetical protein
LRPAAPAPAATRGACEVTEALEALKALEALGVSAPSAFSALVALPLTELESLPGFRPSRLLALDRSCIAGEQTEIAQLAAMALIEPYECASHGETQRTGLPAHTTTIDPRTHVETPERVACRSR